MVWGCLMSIIVVWGVAGRRSREVVASEPHIRHTDSDSESLNFGCHRVDDKVGGSPVAVVFATRLFLNVAGTLPHDRLSPAMCAVRRRWMLDRFTFLFSAPQNIIKYACV